MSMQLTHFRIEGLHKTHTIDIPLQSNTLILVGENGTGKSTVVNLIYFFLTAQWSRMLETEFSSIVAIIDSDEYQLSRKEIRILSGERERNEFPRSLSRRIAQEVNGLSLEKVREKLPKLADDLRLPQSIVWQITLSLDVDNSELDNEKKDKIKKLRSRATNQIVYLPTYRRIEQDLERIFPEYFEEDGYPLRARRFESKKRRSSRGEGYIELVEFGMEDVKRTIREKMGEIKEKSRTDLNNLMGEYLRDIIREEYRSVESTALHKLKEIPIDAIFRRIPSEILQRDDKDTLRSKIQTIADTGNIGGDDKIVAHFLTKLIQLYQKQQKDEEDIREFVKVCNQGYLTGKELTYDDTNFEVSIVQKFESEAINKTSLQMKSLSSGEKQIVSLFSHLYLSEDNKPFIIIDEPELSLSVPWQKRFLPDIYQRCEGLISVTHSPFIYDNHLKDYVHSLEEFTIPFDYNPFEDEDAILEQDRLL